MATKEVMVTAPVMVALYDRVFAFGSFRQAIARRWRFYVPLAATWGILAALMIAGPRSRTAGFGLDTTPFQYAQAQCGVVLHYLRLTFWPHPLVLDYAWPLPDSLAKVLIPATGILVLLGATIVALRYRPAVGFLGVWLFGILGPSSSFVPIKDLAFEHRMYLPLAAVVAGVVLGAYALGRRLTRSHGRILAAAGVGMAVGIAGVLGWRTHLRNNDYRNEIAIWNDTLTKVPWNYRAHNNLGYAYRRAGQYDLAVSHYNRAIELKPDYSRAFNNRGAAYGFMGRHDEALADFKMAIRLEPDLASAYCNRGVALMAKGDRQQAMKDFDASITLSPNYVWAYVCRGNALASGGQYDLALAEYDRALKLMPDSQDAAEGRDKALAGRARQRTQPN
jgi:tetratricopeptide (TPR) repeat protein